MIDQRREELLNKTSRELVKSYKNSIFLKFFYDEKIISETVVRSPSRDLYKYRLESFANYFLDKENFALIKRNLKSDFIFRTQRERRSILEYFRELSSTPKFYDVLEKLKKKMNYLYDIREIGGTIKITVGSQDGEKAFIPFESMGDGFQSLLILNMLFELFQSGIVLLEEPENFLHPGYMELLVDLIISKSDKHQYFLSTHSLELIELLVEKAEKRNQLDKILVLRLSRNENKIDREILLKNEILDELKNIKIDLRGY